MKSKDFIGTSEVYLDMDGVLADFFSEYAKLAGIESGNYRDIPPAKVDPTLDKMIGTDFFNRLPVCNNAEQVVSTSVKIFGHYNICSSPLRGDFKNSEQWKKVWIERNLSPAPTKILITPNKAKYAKQPDGTPNILVDDRGSNITAWEAAGGIGIKYQADENSMGDLVAGFKRAMSILAKEKPHEPQKLQSLDRGKMIAVQSSGDSDEEPHQPLKESIEGNQELVSNFIRWVYQKLHINLPMPKIEFADKKESDHQDRTGYYNPATHVMWIYTGNRNLVDILRTVAHELTHHKQREENTEINTAKLSKIESQADMAAGMLMKLWIKKHPEIVQ